MKCRVMQISTLEFSRDRKMMSVLTRREGQCVLWVKGAPEAVIARCSKVASLSCALTHCCSRIVILGPMC